MTRTLTSILDWQALRVLARAGKPRPGRELRFTPTRGNKDGTFLDDLVRFGLIEVVEVLPEQKRTAYSASGPVQFRTVYRLTEQGARAAEYGEFEYDFDAARKKAQEGGAA